MEEELKQVEVRNNILIEDLFNAGFQYGHKAIKSTPKMKKYIYGVKWGISVIDLCQTAVMFSAALDFLYKIVQKGGNVLFLGTKYQAKDLIRQYAEESGQLFINKRWLGGSLTNYSCTVLNKVKQLEQIERLEDLGTIAKYSKKEQLKIALAKKKNLELIQGVRSMASLPSLIIVVDATKEEIALREAKAMKIPTIVLSDTDTREPSLSQFTIPGNDDGFASINFFLKQCFDVIMQGISNREEKKASEKIFIPEAEVKITEEKLA